MRYRKDTFRCFFCLRGKKSKPWAFVVYHRAAIKRHPCHPHIDKMRVNMNRLQSMGWPRPSPNLENTSRLCHEQCLDTLRLMAIRHWNMTSRTTGDNSGIFWVHRIAISQQRTLNDGGPDRNSCSATQRISRKR